MIESVKIPILFDTYKDFLSEFQQQCIDCYYNQDLTFAEIAQNTNKSRQGVRDAVRRAEILLCQTDKNLNFIEKLGMLENKIIKIGEAIEKIRNENLKREIISMQKEILKMIESW